MKQILRHKNYLLTILFLVQLFNGIDGIALGLVLQNIKSDLHFSDVQLSLLSGFGFALMYALSGVAIGRWADRGDRIAIISLTTALWSMLVAGCGMARNFLQLLLLRGAVGLCQAGCLPASQSLIADYFNRAERPRANAVYLIAGSVMGLLGYSLGGWLSQLYGWRITFVMLGLPGVGVAVLAWLTLKDPRFEQQHRRQPEIFGGLDSESAAIGGQPFGQTLSTLWVNSTLRRLLFFWSTLGFLGFGLSNWLAAFLIRSYRLNTGELGTWLAIVIGVGGSVGPLLGSAWVYRYALNNERLQLRAMGVACCGLTVVTSATYLVPNHYLALGLTGLYALISTAMLVPFWAIIQTLVPQRMCGGVIALLMLFAVLIGNGLGPLATGALSDALRASFGEESLRWASLALCPGFLLAAWLLRLASRSAMSDVTARQEGHAELEVATCEPDRSERPAIGGLRRDPDPR